MKIPNFLSLILVSCFLIPSQAQQTRPSAPSPQTPSKPGQSDADVGDQDVIRINTNLVQIDAVVTKNGQQVIDLNAEDFEVFQDGKPQAITNFSYISNVSVGAANVAAAPVKKTGTPVIPAKIQPQDAHRTIAFVVDDLGMAFESIDRARKQLRKFVNEQMSPNDLVAILRTSGEIGALQQFTTDRRLLLNAIGHVKWHPCSRAGISTFNPSVKICAQETYAITLRALRYIVTGVGSLPGRKSVVVLSDMLPTVDRQDSLTSPNSPAAAAPTGVSAQPVAAPNASGFDPRINEIWTNFEQALQRIAEIAIRGSVVIYPADTRGLEITFPSAADRFGGPASGPGSASRQVGQMISSRSTTLFNDRQGAEILAKETGGFAIHDSNDFGLKKVYEDQQGYYLIGFRPAGETFDRRFHHITIRVNRRGFVVRTRSGFYGMTDEQARSVQRTANSQINAALVSPFGANEIKVRLTAVFANASDSTSVLRSFIYVNARDLAFTDGPDGSHNAAFDVESLLFGDNGRPIYQRSQTATLQLNEQQYAQILREGVVYGFDVPVKDPGALQFRIAVRDKTSSHLGTAGQVVEIPDLRKDQLALSGIVLTSDLDSTAKPQTKLPPTSAPGSVSPGEKENAAVGGPDLVPAVRRFPQGSTLMFGYAVYKARLDNATHLPQLTSQTRIFLDGKLIYTGAIVPIAVSGQPDMQRITGGSRILLGSDFPMGEYVLQIIVTDNLVKDKPRTATQWIDFEVAK